MKRWEKHREKNRLSSLKEKAITQNDKVATNKVSLELLARDWLNELQTTSELRVYLVKNLLPSLVVGLEKLLTEVSHRGYVDDNGENPDFNPINYLGQHLMRNNPKYSNFAEAHPYCRAMQEVTEELKKMGYSIDVEHTMRLKTDIKTRRMERERAELACALEAQRRKALLSGACSKWVLPGNNELITAEVQLALTSWLDLTSTHPMASTLTANFSEPLPTGMISEASLVSRLLEATVDIPGDLLDSLADHLTVCGTEHRRRLHREQRRSLIAGIFDSCDPDKTGFVERLRVLHLFSCLYDSASSDVLDKLHNPRKWPIVEVVDAEDDEERHSTNVVASSLSKQDYKEFLAGQLPTVTEQESSDNVQNDTPEKSQDTKGTDEQGTLDESIPGGEDPPAVDPEAASSPQESTEVETTQEATESVTKETNDVPADETSNVPADETSNVPADKASNVPAEAEETSNVPADETSNVPADNVPADKASNVPTEAEETSNVPADETSNVPADETSNVPADETNDAPADETSNVPADKASNVPTEAEETSNVPAEADEASNVPADDGGPQESEMLGAEVSPGAGDGDGGSTVEVSTDIKEGVIPLKSHAGSVFERRLATASAYGRSASISAMRRLSGMSRRPVSPSGPGGSWDHFLLNRSQFVQLVELFLVTPPLDSTVDTVSSFMQDNYKETAQERSERLELAQQQKFILTRRKRAHSLFEVWDHDRSGYLELDELQLVLSRWKGFSSEEAQKHAKEILLSQGAPRLSREAFQLYIQGLTEDMTLSKFEEFADYLLASVKLTFDEIRRGELRKGLLDRIALTGKSSGLQFSRAMKMAIEAIHKDNAEFGGGKRCSAAMALLDLSSPTPCLIFKAASNEIASRVVGQKLLRSLKQGVSFKAVDSARPVFVQNIRRHGGVYFLIKDHNQEEYNGSLVVSPIVTPRDSVVGTISVDTLKEQTEDGCQDNTFLTHEINFYQGVGVCLGGVHHWIEARRKLVVVSQSALSWVHRRCPQLSQSALYIVEPSTDTPIRNPYTLRCMLTTSGPNKQTATRKLLIREYDVFRDYLFQCVDNSEPVQGSAYGQHHLAYPIRDSTGCAVAVLDLYMPPTQELKPSQTKEVTKVLKLLTLAYYELSRIPERPTTTAESSGSTTTQSSDRLADGDVSVFFDQLLLSDLQQSVSKLDNKIFAELRSYKDPPGTILGTVQALLCILYPLVEFDSWTKCKQYITVSLMRDLQNFDPLTLEDKQHMKLDQIRQIVSDIGSIEEQGSRPAKYIYSWVDVCLSLLEHAANKHSITLTTGPPSPPPASTTIEGT